MVGLVGDFSGDPLMVRIPSACAVFTVAMPTCGD